MTPDTQIEVGRIIRSRGLQGEVVVFPLTDDLEQFRLFDSVVLVDPGGAESERKLEFLRTTRKQGRTEVHLRIDGVTDRDGADALKGTVIRVDLTQLSLADDEYLLSDLEGVSLILQSGEEIGRVTEVRRMPAQDLLVARSSDGTEILIPDVPEFVDKSRLDDGKLIVTPIEGLLAIS